MSETLERVASTGLLAPGRPVVVLLSGGRDSVCLLDVAVAIGARASALHVNYGLRDDAAGDEELCAALCEALGVALEVRRPRRPEGNLQAWARDVRYAEAARLAQEGGADVAAGHTVTDQAETVLYRLAASPGRRALLGMPVRSGRLVRPLLAAGLTRDDTGAWCAERGLRFADDPTNETDRFARGRLRRGLVPALRAIHPAAERNVVRTAELLADEAAVLDEVVRAALAGRDRIAVDRLGELPRALARLVLIRLAEDAAGEGRYLPAAADRLDDVLAAPDGAAVAVTGGVELCVRGGWISARRQGAGRTPAAVPVPVELAVPGDARFGAWTVSARPAKPEPRDGVLAFPGAPAAFTVRAWRPGDRMAPLGLGGHTRSLQDLFVDRHIPREDRATLPVVECDGEVAWIPGVATSERFRVRDDTPVAVALSASR
jgi:tRNA(Ile)-lysidine synthase